MRTMQLVGTLCVTVTIMLWAAPWSALEVAAQSLAQPQRCLSFHEVHPSLSTNEALEKGIPAGYRVYPGPDEKLLLRAEPLLHGADMVDAQPSFDERMKRPIIIFRFNAAGRDTFAAFTRSNVGQPFAIVVDGRVVATPIIREPILDGQGQIEGGFTSDSAAQLAARIRSGKCA
jgi:preprotein translocase subunit SecD